MKIGIDARFIGPQGTGLGKYTEKLITCLAKIDRKNFYWIFLNKSNWDYLTLPKNFNKVLVNIPWYSLAEQLKMPTVIKQQNLDLVHIPHFNVPILYKGKFVVTIHDLIHHKFSQYATTKNPIIFQIKRFAYKKVISYAVTKSAKILTPSNFVKEEIIETFKINPGKIVVTYEAAEEEYFNRELSTVNREPFLIYVGNAYPHKNLEKLLDAFRILVHSSQFTVHSNQKTVNHEPTTDNLRLLIVCPRDVFSQRLHSEIQNRKLEDRVELKGYLKPTELAKLFQKATAYVFPSLSEGFGIPGLNAMASGLPVVASNIPAFKEVYGDAVLYFDPKDSKDIADKIEKILTNPKTKSNLVEKGREQAKKYSWQKMAKQTLGVYEEVA